MKGISVRRVLGTVAAVALLIGIPLLVTPHADANPVKKAGTMMGLDGWATTYHQGTTTEVEPPDHPIAGDEVHFELSAYVIFGGDVLSDSVKLEFKKYNVATKQYELVDVDDPPSEGKIAWECTSTPGEYLGPEADVTEVECTAIYILTGDDAINGLLFQIVVQGLDDDGSWHSNADAPLRLKHPYGAMSLIKSVRPNVWQDGDGPLTYKFEIMYQGTLDLGPVTITDALLGAPFV